MSERLIVRRNRKAIYDIVLEPSYEELSEEVSSLGIEQRRLCIVTDSHVADLYLSEISERLSPCVKQIDHFVFPAGEEHKNLDTIRGLYECLIQKHYDRGDILVALGGGVTGDLCGFAAATYLRGIRFIQLPTTLLSQVDSSIGGKTGVDFDSYKNMVGAFHMPSLVYASIGSLKTLSEEQYCSGIGEIIKHGLIKNSEYFYWLKEHTSQILARDPEICLNMILESCKIKRDLVETDPTEQGERALLNFGHTLGHAIEKLMDFSLLHGECVSIGCAAATWLSAQRGLISQAECELIIKTLKSFHLPVSIADMGLSVEQILETTKNDKKMDSGQIKFILLRRLGEAYIDRTVTDEEIRKVAAWLGGTYEG